MGIRSLGQCPKLGDTVVHGCEQEHHETGKEKLEWLHASEVHICPEQISRKYEPTEYEENKSFPNISLRLVRPEKIAVNLKSDNAGVIIEAESQHSDLIPAKYEGGLKVWECTYDLANYLLQQENSLQNRRVLDLGCGAGLIGILCLLKGSTVHFQDYNEEVIKSVTIPNVILNLGNTTADTEKTRFYCGDWKSFTFLLSNDASDENTKYDFIFTSETIYNKSNHEKLYDVFKQKLKFGGVGFVAGKTYYFGVGGSMRQFEELVIKDGIFKVQVAWRSNEGLQREILILSHCNNHQI